MPDIFDKIGAEQRGDVFDRIAQEPPKSRFRAAIDQQKEVLENAKNFGLGILKGAGSTAFNLGSLADRAGRGIARGLGADVAPQGEAFTGANPITDALEAQGGWQGAGKATEQVGEFFVPGAAEAGVLKPLAKLAGKAGIVGRMGTEAANAAGVTAAQGGDASTAAIGAAATVPIGAAIGKAAPAAMQAFLKAPPKAYRHGANPGNVINEGAWAGSTSGLAKTFGEVKSTIGKQMDEVMLGSRAAGTTRIDLTAAIDGPINKAKASSLGRDTGELDRMREWLYEQFSASGTSHSAATAREALHVRKLMDDGINYDTNAAGFQKVAKEVRRNIERQIESVVPELKPLNQRYSDVAEAAKALREKTIGPGRGASIMGPLLLAAAGGGGAYMLRNRPGDAVAGAAANTALTSTLGATVGAQALRGIGSGKGGNLAKLAGAGLSAMTNPDPKEEYLRKLIAGER